MFEHLMRNAIDGMIWVVRHPGETTLGLVVAFCVCMIVAAVILSRWERRDQAHATAAIERARRIQALNPKVKVSPPRAASMHPTRVGR